MKTFNEFVNTNSPDNYHDIDSMTIIEQKIKLPTDMNLDITYIYLKDKLNELWELIRPSTPFEIEKHNHILNILVMISYICKLSAEQNCTVKKEEPTEEKQKTADQKKIEEYQRTLQIIRFGIMQAPISDIQKGNSGNVIVDKNYVLTLIKNVLDE